MASSKKSKRLWISKHSFQFYWLPSYYLHFNIIQVCEDFNILYPANVQLFPDWNTFLGKWIFISDKLVTIRKNSVKDKVAKDLLKQLDDVQQSGSKW